MSSEEKSKFKEQVSLLTLSIASQEVSQAGDAEQLSHVLSDLSQAISSDTELASDQQLTQNTLLAVSSVLSGEK